MTDYRSAALVAEYTRVRDGLLASFPELADDAGALADTVDGETELMDAITRLIRQSREDDAVEAALDTIIVEMRERKARIGSRSSKRREAALALLLAADVPKLDRPDFTATVSNGRAKVMISDEAAVPLDLCRIVRNPDKPAIKQALDAGREVPGALLSNPEPILTVRTR